MSFFSIGRQKIWGPKQPIFDEFATQNNFEGQYLRQGTSENAYTVLKFHELWSAKAKNRTVVFTHPPRSSSAWRQWLSRWPAL